MISSMHIEKKMARTISQLRDVVNIIYLEIQFNSMTSDKDISMKLSENLVHVVVIELPFRYGPFSIRRSCLQNRI